jgi:1-deoxy-D-xylulose-5-phosphate reductoisomerase
VRNLVILGSTGSIGRNALDIVDRHPGEFKIIGLSANSNAELLARQVQRYNPPYAAIGDRAGLAFLKESSTITTTEYYGPEGIEKICGLAEVEIVLNAIVDSAGLQATISALKAGKRGALANKESMVAAGPLLRKLAIENGGEIIPVDSEHSAIFQCLQAGKKSEVARLILTSSGGPFRNRDDLREITPEQALNHPTWKMGPKITIDSATLMNKALEIIEAAYLFDLPGEKISVVIHPQSIVHSMVEFIDGSTIAQMSKPDMRLPIQYALFYPNRKPLDVCQLDFTNNLTLEFFPPQTKKFRSLGLAYKAVADGGTMPAVMNAANEVAVQAFLDKKITFLQIYEIIEQTMIKTGSGKADFLNDILEANQRAIEMAKGIVVSIAGL